MCNAVPLKQVLSLHFKMASRMPTFRKINGITHLLRAAETQNRRRLGLQKLWKS